jgi:L-ascorbate metabolism protein UlaG (beta-lactamase superfamily)
MDTSFITVNYNSSIRVEAEGKVIYFDPYMIDGEPKDADYIFLTHDHYDHFSVKDISKIIKADTVLVYPKRMGLVMKVVSTSGEKVPVLPENNYNAAGLNFDTVPSYNIIKPFHLKFMKNCGYIINVNGLKIYVSGDMDVTKEALAVKCDIALIPIGGFYTMNPKSAARLINNMKPKAAIPTHYGKVAGKPSYGEDFKRLVDEAIQVDLKLTK